MTVNSFSHRKTANSERMEYLDMARGIGILFVVLGHHLAGAETLTEWIYSFHMPLFFIISGWIYAHKRPQTSLRALGAKRAGALLYPYTVFSLLILAWKYALYFLLGSYPDENFSEIWLKFATTYGYHALWFLPTLFFSEIIVHCIETRTIFKHRRMIIYLLFVAGGWIISGFMEAGLPSGFLDYAMRYAGRICLAVMFCKIGMVIQPYLCAADRRNRFLLAVGTAVLSCVLFRVNGLANMGVFRIGSFPIYVLLGLCGSLPVILWCQMLGKSRYFSFWGRNSLLVMLTHMDFSIEIAYILLAQLGIGELIGNSFILSLAAIGLELLLEAAAIPIVKRFLPFLLTAPRLSQFYSNRRSL